MSERKDIFKFFTRTQIGSGIVSFDDILIQAIEQALNKKGVDRDNYFDANVNKMWNYINKTQEEDYTYKKVEPIFTIVNNSLRTIKCHLSESYLNTTKLRYNYLQSRPFLLNEIDLITARQYEALSIYLCKLIDANNVLLTPSGNEAGIDFIATIKFSDESHYLFGINGPLRIIGQCKKYSTPVQVDKVKEFNTTLNDVYHLTSKMRSVLPTWFSQSKGIIVGWIIGHSGFQQGAQDRAKDFGIVLSETRELGDLISSSSKFNPTMPIDQRHLSLKKDLQDILDD